MKRLVSLPAVSIVALATAGAPGGNAAAQETQPRLVVLLAADQLSGAMLERYQDAFTGGFRRLLDEGFHYTQAHHFHANTETAAGHAALSTGVLPYRNGIVANSWQEQVGQEWVSVYAVADSASPIAGIPSLAGRSPANMLREGLGDWMQNADPESRILSVSRKDRAAITLVGRTSNAHVYWLVPQAARWVTSTYYRTAYSRWFEAFHRDEIPRLFADSTWTSSVPVELRSLARGDTASYEGDGVHTTFPHRFVDEADTTVPSAYASWVSSTPWVDQATLALARRGMNALDLGQDGVPDYLAIALSQVDIIGHSYGPFSLEQLDNLLRLDRALGEFLTFLDEHVGEGRWVLGLSADHGVLPMPEYLQESGIGGMRTSQEQIQRLLAGVQRAVSESDGSPAEVAAGVKAAALDQDWIEAAYTAWDLRDGEPADTFEVLYENSYMPERATGFFGQLGVQVRTGEHVLTTTSPQGTSHGSPYWYDRHVPLIFLGAGVEPGESAVSARTIDMAPTLAALAGIPFPEDLDGVPLLR